MPTRIEEDNAYVNLTAELKESVMRVVWKKYPPSAVYRDTLTKAAEWVEKFELKYYLSDNRERGAILHEDEGWVLKEWAPRMNSTKLVRSALVQSSDFFNAITLERIVDKAQREIPIRFFRSVPEAHHWLMTGEELFSEAKAR